MLYIDDIGNNTIRFGNAAGGGTYPKFMANNLIARSDEIGRVWVEETVTGTEVLNCYDPTQINLEGSVYTVAGAFVQAFNAMIAEEAMVTTTTTTAAVTTTTTRPVTTTTTTSA